jgi:hypothetical protein
VWFTGEIRRETAPSGALHRDPRPPSGGAKSSACVPLSTPGRASCWAPPFFLTLPALFFSAARRQRSRSLFGLPYAWSASATAPPAPGRLHWRHPPRLGTPCVRRRARGQAAALPPRRPPSSSAASSRASSPTAIRRRCTSFTSATSAATATPRARPRPPSSPPKAPAPRQRAKPIPKVTPQGVPACSTTPCGPSSKSLASPTM